MTKNELIDFIDKNLILFKNGLQSELDEVKADFISDIFIFDIEFKIAQFAVENNHTAVIKGLTLEQLVNENNIVDEDGYDIFVSEYISNWISTTSGSIVYDFIQQKIPKSEIIEIINYYENKILPN